MDCFVSRQVREALLQETGSWHGEVVTEGGLRPATTRLTMVNMIALANFEVCEPSNRYYGGDAGRKVGVVYDGETGF